jgi:hypothetical protein
MTTNGASTSQKAVTVSLQALKDGTQSPGNLYQAQSITTTTGAVPFSSLEEAFGPDSLGIIVVKDLPAKFMELRRNLLSYSSYLANLPDTELGNHFLLFHRTNQGRKGSDLRHRETRVPRSQMARRLVLRQRKTKGRCIRHPKRLLLRELRAFLLRQQFRRRVK